MCLLVPRYQTVMLKVQLTQYLKQKLTVYPPVLVRKMKTAVLILFLILAPFSKAYSEVSLYNISGGSTHRLSSVYSGYFTALDGSQHDASSFYKSKRFEFFTSGLASCGVNENLNILIPFAFDAGYQSDLFVSQPSFILGFGAIYTSRRWDVSGVFQNLLSIGGKVTEKSCVDSLDRDFHCGTGIPWSDYQTVQPDTPVSFKFNVSYKF